MAKNMGNLMKDGVWCHEQLHNKPANAKQRKTSREYSGHDKRGHENNAPQNQVQLSAYLCEWQNIECVCKWYTIC